MTRVPGAVAGLLDGRSAAAPPLGRHKNWRMSRSPAPKSPPLTPSLGPLTPWRSRQGQIPPGRSGLPHGRCPHLAPLHPQITADLLSNGIDVYPQKEFDEDAEDRLVNEKFRVSESPWALLPPKGVGWGLPAPSRGLREMAGWPRAMRTSLSGLVGVAARVSTAALSAAGPQAPDSASRGPSCDPRHRPLPQEMIPFAVVGSDHEYQVNGKRILGRKTKWGTIEGKSPADVQGRWTGQQNRAASAHQAPHPLGCPRPTGETGGASGSSRRGCQVLMELRVSPDLPLVGQFLGRKD